MRVRLAQDLTVVVDNPDLACAQANSYSGASAARLRLDASPVVGVRLRLEVAFDEYTLEALDGGAGSCLVLLVVSRAVLEARKYRSNCGVVALWRHPSRGVD